MRSDSFDLFDVVEVTSPPKGALVHAGDKGTIVEILSPDAFEVEFIRDDGKTWYLGPFRINELRKV